MHRRVNFAHRCVSRCPRMTGILSHLGEIQSSMTADHASMRDPHHPPSAAPLLSDRNSVMREWNSVCAGWSSIIDTRKSDTVHGLRHAVLLARTATRWLPASAWRCRAVEALWLDRIGRSSVMPLRCAIAVEIEPCAVGSAAGAGPAACPRSDSSRPDAFA